MKEHGETLAPRADGVSDSSAGSAAQTARAMRAPITDRVNGEPAIMNGMTVSEGKWIAVLCLAIYAIAGGLLWLITGWWQVMIGVTLFGSGATLWFVSLYLAKVKRGRPEGYYQQAMHLWLSARSPLAGCRFTRRAGFWSLGRMAPGLTSPLEVHERTPTHIPPARTPASAPAHIPAISPIQKDRP